MKLLLLLMLVGALPSLGLAQYPSKPIRMIVPVPAGGPSDNAARILGQALSKSLGQQVVVDNRPGAGGAIGALAASAAPADGHTLLWALSSMVAIPLLQKTPPFQSFSEFTPVSIVCRLPFAMVVHPTVPARSVGEFVAYARAHPGKLNFATGPLGEFMTGAHFMKATGIRMVRVPYKGGAQAIHDVVAGSVEVYFTPISLILPYAKAGRLRMLATLGTDRSVYAPEVPTMAEAGVSMIPTPGWNGVVGPAKMPTGIADRLARDVQRHLQAPDVRAALESQGLLAEGSSRQEAAVAITAALETWRRFILENDIPRE